MKNADAILVPGGGVRADGKLPLWTRTRFDHALSLAGPDTVIICLSAGTVHKAPPPDEKGHPLFESACGARYLLELGFPAHRVRHETCSYDTIGNAYFARVLHTDPVELHRLHVVTSDFHLERTRHIFEWIFGLGTEKYELDFTGTPDLGIPAESLAARQAKENKSIADLRPVMDRIDSMRLLHQFIFGEHDAYRVHRNTESSAAELLDTY